VIDPQYGIPFTDPAHPGSGEAQADKHRRHKKMRGPLRAAGFQVPAPEDESLDSTAASTGACPVPGEPEAGA
jgi:hypothetical protein